MSKLEFTVKNTFLRKLYFRYVTLSDIQLYSCYWLLIVLTISLKFVERNFLRESEVLRKSEGKGMQGMKNDRISSVFFGKLAVTF